MFKRIIPTAVSLILTIAVIAMGAVMPSLLSLISDGRLEHDISIRTGDTVKLTFAEETPSNALESVAYFSYLDGDDGKFYAENTILDSERVRAIVYEFFTADWCVSSLNRPITSEYDGWFTIVLPMVYTVRKQNDESFEEQSSHVFWECFWKTSDGRRFKVWVDDSSTSIVAFRSALDKNLLNEYGDGDTYYNFLYEEKVVNTFAAVFRDYYGTDSTDPYFSAPVFDTSTMNFIDVWIINFISTEQHNGISSDSIVKMVVYFTGSGVYFNLENPSRFV